MKTVVRLFLSCLGFVGVVLISYYFDPRALDSVGFFIFYLALVFGSFNCFLLLRLNALQASLLTLLFVAFLLLRQLALFNGWLGLGLVLGVIIIEHAFSKR